MPPEPQSGDLTEIAHAEALVTIFFLSSCPQLSAHHRWSLHVGLSYLQRRDVSDLGPGRRRLASTPARRLSSRHLSTSRRSSIASLPPPPHSKRNTNVSQDPRYAEIQHIASHDPQNWLYPWTVFDAMGDSPQPESYSRLLHVRLSQR